ncbi:hypothetical protein [Xanthomonas arboricola]|uniref:hypothetical protein n=1 Tax=Xanthomonas arboricola TaxID=56448 RepID=UPI000585229C|nr:hypothetical protein [Xanthomonas arboricola]
MKRLYLVSISFQVDVTYLIPLRGTTPDGVVNELLALDPKLAAKRLKKRADYFVTGMDRCLCAGLKGKILKEVPERSFDRADEISMPRGLHAWPRAVLVNGHGLASKTFEFKAASLKDALDQFDLVAPVDLEYAPWSIWGIGLDPDLSADGHPGWTPEVEGSDLDDIGYALATTLR